MIEMIDQSSHRQAEQNQTMADLHKQVAENTGRLIEAENEARRELTALQRELHDEQSEIRKRHDKLNAERRSIAAQRQRDPIIANAIILIGSVLACLVPLAIAWQLLRCLETEGINEDAISSLLIDELVADRPVLLSGPTMPVIGDQPSQPLLADGTESDAGE